jgi:dihydroneopterin aldolase
MLSIYLQKLRFKSFHGLYPEEKVLGNQFEVNLTVKYLPQHLPIVNIEQTINYQDLFEIVEKRMLVPTELLETLAPIITDDIFAAYPFVKNIIISIAKFNPPIDRFNGNVAVSFEKNY